MISKPIGIEEISVFRRVAPRIGFVAALPLLAAFAPMAHAQTNIDQGKSPSEIFANDCAVCHKTTRGLAAGKNSLMLSGFLREHYTASRDQAAALAAYVLGAGGGSGPPPPPPSQKPGTDRTRAAVEEPKPGEPGTSEPRIAEPKTSEPKTLEPKREPKTAARPAHPSAKPEEEVRPVTASRGHKLEPEPAIPPQEPAAVVAVPAVSETPRSAEAPSQDANPVANVPTTSAAAPAESQPSDSEAVPRDDIPD